MSYRGEPLTDKQRLRFGYMPEERGLYPKMKIGEQLGYFARFSGVDRRTASNDAEEWLARFGLENRRSDKLETLSHGNQQRVQLAVSLIHKPEVAVLDEPFAGLDPMGMETMAETLRQLAADGVAIVFSSHQLDLVEDIYQDVIIVSRGKNVLAGEVAALRNQSEIRYLEIDVDGTPWTADLPGVRAVKRDNRDRYVADHTVSLTDLFAEAARAGVITRFSFEPPGLSDLFRDAVTA